MADAPHLLDATMFWNPSGGVRRYVLAKRQFAQAYHPHWRHTIANPTPDAADQLRVPGWPLPGSGGSYRLPWRRAATARLLAAARPDLIEAADPYRLGWAALDAAAQLSVPAVAFCHSNLDQLARSALGGGRAGALAARAARRYAVHLYRHFDLVLAPSEAMATHLRGWGVPRVQRQPLGVDCKVFHPDRGDPAWRSALGLPADARLLVFAGRFAPEKNLSVLVDAVRQLGPRYWLLAIGAGPQPPRGERVICHPLQLDAVQLATALASSDVFVHAGAQETFGLSVLEALACGTPVVARAAEGLAELVDAPVGLGVGSGRTDAFAEAITAVCEQPRAALSAAARARAAGYAWDQVLPPLWQQYGRLMGHNEALSPAAPIDLSQAQAVIRP
ncbi:MAG: glycosyltransferase [Burkholderiales bacterium]